MIELKQEINKVILYYFVIQKSLADKYIVTDNTAVNNILNRRTKKSNADGYCYPNRFFRLNLTLSLNYTVLELCIHHRKLYRCYSLNLLSLSNYFFSRLNLTLYINLNLKHYYLSYLSIHSPKYNPFLSSPSLYYQNTEIAINVT